jgi:hypothetical protein
MLSSDNLLIRNLCNEGIPVLKTEFCGHIDYWMTTKFVPAGELGADEWYHTVEGYNITETINGVFLGSDLAQRIMDFVSQNPLIKLKLHKDCKYMYFTSSSKNKINPIANVS